MSRTKSSAKAESWIKQLENGNLKSKTVQVLKFIKENPYTTLHAIRLALSGISHQTITCVISVSLDEGAIMIMGRIKIEDNPYSQYYFIQDPKTRANLKIERKKEMFVAWAKQGLSNYSDMLPESIKQELEAKTCGITIRDMSTLFKQGHGYTP